MQLEFGKPYKIVEQVSENYSLNEVTGINGDIFGEGESRYFEFWFEDDLVETTAVFVNTRLSNPTINLNIQKTINGNQEDYYRLNINPSSAFNFKISLREQNTGKLINGILSTNNSLIINNLSEGTYIISEGSEMLFDLFDIELLNLINGVSLNKINNQYVLDINGIDFDKTNDLNITNSLEGISIYEDFENKTNLFLSRSDGNEREEQ